MDLPCWHWNRFPSSRLCYYSTAESRDRYHPPLYSRAHRRVLRVPQTPKPIALTVQHYSCIHKPFSIDVSCNVNVWSCSIGVFLFLLFSAVVVVLCVYVLWGFAAWYKQISKIKVSIILIKIVLWLRVANCSRLRYGRLSWPALSGQLLGAL